MKKIYIGLISFLLLATSCENFLDRQPKSELSVETYWQSEQDLKTWNAGMYDGLQSTLRTGWFDWGELRGGTFVSRGTSYDINLLFNGLNSQSGTSSWGSIYSTIYRANAAIKHVPECPIGATLSDPYLAQAYTMRALMYFYAIRIWGDVPMITEPMEDVSSQQRYYERTSIYEIEKLMLEDLENATRLFGPVSNLADANKYYLSKGAALAIKMDILMWFKHYDEALLIADELITGSGYALVQGEGYRSQFLNPAGSNEMIFNLYWDYVEDNNGFGYSQRIASGSYTTPYHLQKNIFNDLIARKQNDSRVNMVIDTLWISATIKAFGESSINEETYQKGYDGYYGNPAAWIIRCPKFCEYGATAFNGGPGYLYFNNADDNTKMPLYRLADIYLLKAEALAQCTTPKLQEALDIVNLIRERAGWTSKATLDVYPTVNKLINLIIDERTIELWGEGKRWFDLVRNDKVKEYLDPYLRDQGEYSIEEGFVIGVEKPSVNHVGGYGKILWPLNQDVFKKNPEMIGHQNKPYEE